jgi:hypothetical protein
MFHYERKKVERISEGEPEFYKDRKEWQTIISGIDEVGGSGEQ